jgi:hypothetical protein
MGSPPCGAATFTPSSANRIALVTVIGAARSLTINDYARCVVALGWPAFASRLWQRYYYERIFRN